MKYRAEIDGLRAFAVIPVILFHAGFSLFSGGFVGVDIFFVISGYLITTILIDEIEQNKFSIVNFYERRARRILPALALVMLLCVPLAWMYMPTENHKEFLHSLVAVSLFGSNILFWLESGYFEAASEEKPLLHTWSLAVEEQYYLLFPVFLFLFWRMGKSRVFVLIAFMAGVSLLLSEWGWRHNASANFFLAPFRAWELFAGSMVAFFIQKYGVKQNNLLSLAGFLGVLYATFAFDRFTPFPSVYALVPVVGTSLIILFSGTNTWVNRLLSAKVFVGIGLVSYSAYLWHQPLFAYGRILSAEPFSHVTMLGLSGLSLALAYLSWRYIEGPFRRKDKFDRRAIFTFSGCFMAVFIAYGSIASHFASQLNSGQFNDLEHYRLSENSGRNLELRTASWEWVRQRDEGTLWFDMSTNSKKVLIIGNSHSKDMYNALSLSHYAQTEYEFARLASQIYEIPANYAEISAQPNFKNADVVVLASRYQKRDLAAFVPVIKMLKQAGKEVVVVKNIHEFPEYRTRKWTLAEFIGYSVQQEGESLSDTALATRINQAYYSAYKHNESAERVDFSGGVKDINDAITELSETFPDLPVLDRMDYICDDSAQSCDAVSDNLDKFFYDYGHNTLAGAEQFAKNIDSTRWFAIEK